MLGSKLVKCRRASYKGLMRSVAAAPDKLNVLFQAFLEQLDSANKTRASATKADRLLKFCRNNIADSYQAPLRGIASVPPALLLGMAYLQPRLSARSVLQ